ncbi:transcription initiation factor IIB family protein [Pyrobaculum sp. 3827-6]|jgi:transcription initiation factor TFIIB|uniref:transcription initiation factor IIB family protein n=1 Tax=Pyrobaculum sp. 3827-6 TaxID=2983604 RepID=UPI0021D85C70|nr:transcription initiation factor IIB family protein [Pyrobaculum sp. 3827-6]MCU7787186.1 transcription initiation factor IIB family protein [Pyrobaculum sp. 3827-6]
MTRRLIFEVEEYSCPVCGSVNEVVVDYERGQVICKNCGTVLRDGIADLGPEWRKPESSRAYSGPMGSSIGDIEYGNVKVIDKIKAISLKKFSRPISTPLERVEADIREFLESAREKLGIPRNIIEDSVMLYKKLYEAGYRAPRLESYAATLYFSLKRHGVAAITLKKVIEGLGVDRSSFVSAYMELMNIASKLGIKPPRVDPKIYIPKIVSALGIGDEKSAEVQRIAVDILRYIISIPRVRNGRKPQVLAAAAVYYACYIAGVEVTQKEVAKAADSTEGPVRELLKDLSDVLFVEVSV